MRILIDTCVLFPTLLRAIVLNVADTGAFEPVWSARILEEWRRAMAREGQDASADIALLEDRFPTALIPVGESGGIWLPDENDVHVLAAAVSNGANAILTLNLKDFPTRIVSSYGLVRRAPDEFLLECYNQDQSAVGDAVRGVIARAQAAGAQAAPRALLKRARLPRLGKAIFG